MDIYLAVWAGLVWILGRIFWGLNLSC
jgi:hypothetical protein